MSEVIIPCAVIVRMASVLKYFNESADDWTNSIRLEDDYMMTTNRCFMSVQLLSASVGKPFHIKNDPALIAQCATEAPFNSNLHIVHNEMLEMVTARTTLGYQYPGNLIHSPITHNSQAAWRDIPPRNPAPKSKGGLYMDLTGINMLIEASPSGKIIFEEHIDNRQATIVVDSLDNTWFGVFNPTSDGDYEAATLPEWFK